MEDVVIAGGGLAGLISSIALRKAGHRVTLIEKKEYPFHRVCGEYISNEVRPYLERNDLFPGEFNPSFIHKFWLTATNGKKSELPLTMGAFGISRYNFDLFLYRKASDLGVTFMLGESVNKMDFANDIFKVSTLNGKEVEARYAIGAFGKRSVMDKQMDRPFIQKKSPYIGVKYHIKTDFPEDVIALHNFTDGYCGISKIEDDTYNLCYLSHRSNLKKYGNIRAMEEAVLWKNPHLKEIYQSSDFLFDNPEVINEISFERKSPIVNHVLMTGDSAGLITPLCGNGMAMAIHSGKILADTIINNAMDNRAKIENDYVKAWENQFRRRLWAGRQIQRMFGSDTMSNFAVNLANYAKPLACLLIEQTHGKSF